MRELLTKVLLLFHKHTREDTILHYLTAMLQSHIPKLFHKLIKWLRQLLFLNRYSLRTCYMGYHHRFNRLCLLLWSAPPSPVTFVVVVVLATQKVDTAKPDKYIYLKWKQWRWLLLIQALIHQFLIVAHHLKKSLIQ